MIRRTSLPCLAIYCAATYRLAVFCLTVFALPAGAAEILVSTVSDRIAEDFRCTLREAIIAANTDTAFSDCDAGSGPDVISLFFTSDHVMSVAGINEDLNQTGDFDIRDDLTIRPADPGVMVTIDGAQLDRIFEVFDGADLTLERIRLTGGMVTGFGGAIFTQQGGSELRVVSSILEGNESSLFGGGISAEGPLLLEDSMVVSNESAFGGGIYMSSANPATLESSTVLDNFATADGGGLNVRVLSARDSTIAMNRALRDGGGIIWRTNGDAADLSQLSNSTIAENESDEDGGGLCFVSPGTLELYNVTVAWNEADKDENDNGDGGGIFVGNGTVRPRSSIFAANEDLSFGAAASLAPNCFGAVDSQNHNLFAAVDFADCAISGLTSGDINGPLGNPIDHQLGCLEDNGGPTSTVLPAATSPVVDRGDPAGCAAATGGNLGTDQRGQVRHWDGPDADTTARCDMGAVEVGAPPSAIFADGFESGNTSAWGPPPAAQKAWLRQWLPSRMAAKGDAPGGCGGSDE